MENPNNYFTNKNIYLIYYPNGQNAQFSNGIVKNIFEDNYTISYLFTSKEESSGCPLINILNHKVIGVNKGRKENQNSNFGTLLNIPIQEFNQKYSFNNNLNDINNGFLMEKSNFINNINNQNMDLGNKLNLNNNNPQNVDFNNCQIMDNNNNLNMNFNNNNNDNNNLNMNFNNSQNINFIYNNQNIDCNNNQNMNFYNNQCMNCNNNQNMDYNNNLNMNFNNSNQNMNFNNNNPNNFNNNIKNININNNNQVLNINNNYNNNNQNINLYNSYQNINLNNNNNNNQNMNINKSCQNMNLNNIQQNMNFNNIYQNMDFNNNQNINCNNNQNFNNIQQYMNLNNNNQNICFNNSNQNMNFDIKNHNIYVDYNDLNKNFNNKVNMNNNQNNINQDMDLNQNLYNSDINNNNQISKNIIQQNNQFNMSMLDKNFMNNIKMQQSSENIYPYIKGNRKKIIFINSNNESKIVKIPISLRKNEIYSIAEKYKSSEYYEIIQLMHNNILLENDDSSIDCILDGDSIKIMEFLDCDLSYYDSLILKHKNSPIIKNITFQTETKLINITYLPNDITAAEMKKSCFCRLRIPFKYIDEFFFLLDGSIINDNQILKDFMHRDSLRINVLLKNSIFNGIKSIEGKKIKASLFFNDKIYESFSPFIGTLNQLKDFYQIINNLFIPDFPFTKIGNGIIYPDNIEVKENDERTFSEIGIR